MVPEVTVQLPGWWPEPGSCGSYMVGWLPGFLLHGRGWFPGQVAEGCGSNFYFYVVWPVSVCLILLIAATRAQLAISAASVGVRGVLTPCM